MNKPDFRIFRNDRTHDWTDDIVARAGRLWDVLLFNGNRHVYCCEMTPSYEMMFLGSTWERSPQDDDEAEEMGDEIRAVDAQTEAFSYFHVHGINLDGCPAIETTDEEWAEALEDADGDEDQAYENLLERTRDGCCSGNYAECEVG